MKKINNSSQEKKTERFVVEIKKREKRTLLRASDLKFRDNLNIIQKVLLLQKPFCMLQKCKTKVKAMDKNLLIIS